MKIRGTRQRQEACVGLWWWKVCVRKMLSLREWQKTEAFCTIVWGVSRREQKEQMCILPTDKRMGYECESKRHIFWLKRCRRMWWRRQSEETMHRTGFLFSSSSSFCSGRRTDRKRHYEGETRKLMRVESRKARGRSKLTERGKRRVALTGNCTRTVFRSRSNKLRGRDRTRRLHSREEKNCFARHWEHREAVCSSRCRSALV